MPRPRPLRPPPRDRDGQTLQHVQAHLDMIRLGVLETAGLIATKKVGRFQHHHLKAPHDLTCPVVPGAGVADGWARWASGLKTWLETGGDARIGAMIPA